MAKKGFYSYAQQELRLQLWLRKKVCDYLREQGIEFEADQRNVGSVPSIGNDFDLIVASTQVPYDIDTPVISGLPFLTGIGADETLKKIKDVLTK